MTEKLILGDLNAGKLENIDRFISDYLLPAEKSSSCSRDQLSRLVLTAVQFLQASVIQIASSGPHRTILLNAIHTCCNFYSKHQNILTLPEPLTVAKVLYHIVAKLSDLKECAAEVFSICQYLYNELLPLPDNSTGPTASIITNIYSKLWNVAIKLEQDKATQQHEVVLQLRFMAIKMLLLRHVAVGQTVDKFLLAVDRYDKSTVQKSTKRNLTSDHLPVTLVCDVAQFVCDLGAGVVDLTEKDVCSSLSLLQYLHQLIVVQQLHSILETVQQITETFLTTFKAVNYSPVIKNLYEIVYVTVLYSKKSKNSQRTLSDVSSLSETIEDLLEGSGCSLNTGWCLLICECLLVILKQQTLMSSEGKGLLEEVLGYTQKVTQFLIASREEEKILYEEDSEEKNEKLAVMISTKLIIILRTELELSVTLVNYLKDPEGVIRALETIQPLARAYTRQIEQTNHHPPSPDFILRERRQCGYLMSKFAKVSCSLGHQELDLFYYSVECDQLTKWVESDRDLKDQRIREVNLLGIYEMLVDLHWKLGDIEAVLHTLSKCVELEPAHLPTAIELWSRIKREQLRAGNGQITERYFADSVRESHQDLNVFDVLRMELRCFTGTRKKYPETELSLLTRLQQVATLPVQKAESLLEIAQLVWGHFTETHNRPVEEYLSEAEQLLKDVSTHSEMLVMADIKLWKYIIQHENICKRLISSSQKEAPAEESAADLGEEPQPSGTFVCEEMCTFSMEMEIIRHLDLALELWEKVPTNEHTESSLRSLMLCSSILRITGKVDREQLALFLALGVCDAVEDDGGVLNVIKCRLSHIYGTHGMHDQARQLLPSIPDQGAGLDDGYLQTVMSSVMHFLHTKQIQEGLELLTCINEKISQQPSQSKSVCLANGTVKRCWSLFLSLPMDQTPRGAAEEYSLDHAIEAYRNHVSVVYFLLGKEHWAVDNKGLNTTEKYDVMQEYLLSLYHLGQLERLVGDTRSAKFHIKEGWTTAHFMGLPKWALMFMNEFSIIHILSENKSAAISSLTKTCQVLHGNPVSVLVTAKKENSKPRKRKAQKSFGFEEEDGEDGEDDQGRLCCPYPTCWEHMSDNVTCDLCHDNTVKVAVLSYVLVTVKFEVYLYQNLIVETLDKMKNICEKLINLKLQTDQKVRDLPVCGFHENSELKDIYVECLALIAETSLLMGKPDQCANVIDTAQKFFQTQCVSDLVANLIQNKFMVFKAQMCLMRSLTSKRDSLEEEFSGSEGATLLETSIRPEEILPEVSSREEDQPIIEEEQPVIDEECQDLAEDFKSLNISEMIDRSVNQSKARTRTNRGRGRQARGNSTRASKSNQLGTKETEDASEETKKMGAAVQKGRTQAKAVTSTRAASSVTAKSANVKTSNRGSKRQGNKEGSLTEEFTQTPASTAPEFVLKTPYSVSSRKALVFSSDSSDDDEVSSKLPVSNHRGSTVTPTYPDSSSANSTPATSKASSRSRIPKYVNRAKRSDTQQESHDSKGRKTKKQDSTTQENKENMPTKRGTSRRGKAAQSQEPAKVSNAEPAKTSSRGRRKVTEKQNGNSASELIMQTNDEDSIYDFNEVDNQSAKELKTDKKTARRTNTRAKRQPAEKARSNRSDDNETVLMVDIEYCSIEEEVTSFMEEDQFRVPDIQIPKPNLENDDDFLEKIYNLNDSIEIPRGGDNKKSSRGQGGRRMLKSSGQDEQKAGSPTGGEDTTEIPRSTTQVSMQLTMERMRRTAPARKLNKDQGQVDSPRDEDLTSMLEKAFEQARHLPTTGLYSSLCNLLALQYIDTCPLRAAYYLTEGMVVTFRHQSLVNCSRKIRKFKKEMNSDSQKEENGGAQEGEIKNAIYKNLMFNKTPQDLQKIIKDLPEDWTVCQVSMVTNPQVPDQLVLSSMRRDQEPVVVKLPAFKTIHGRKILSEFSDIMEESHDSIKITDKTEWWQSRWKLDDRLRDVLQHMDKYWLGHWRCLIHGSIQTADGGISLSNAAQRVCHSVYKETKIRLSPQVVQRLVESADCLSDTDVRNAICELAGNTVCSSGADNCVTLFRTETNNLKLSDSPGHVLLILDKSVQHLPWECVPSLSKVSISRMPSLYHLHSQLSYLTTQKSSILHTGIDRQRVFYVLNPDSNLASTQETFQGWFSREENWEGIINRKPTKSEYTGALQNKDLFLYCGHGTGGAYLGGSDLASLDCRAATILMGCSSGKLEATGHLEASGFMLNYFMAGCPCMVANLWDVTDKDIDRFLACLLSSWLSEEPAADRRKLLDVIPKARAACRLPHLIGAAPVVYGFPVFLKPS